MRGLMWVSEEQKAAEFRTVAHAHAHALRLQDAPAGIVPDPHSLYEQNIELIDPKTGEPVRLSHRYIIDDAGTILAKAQGMLASDFIGSVAIAETEDGKRYVVKEHNPSMILGESAIAFDLKKATSACTDQKGYRHTLVYRYLGISLEQYLKEKVHYITDVQRLDLAIKTAYAVWELHAGISSLSKEKYAHLDIKPANLTVEEDENVRLIDFGFSEGLDGTMTVGKGTRDYVTPLPGEDFFQEPKEEIDVFALLRTLFLPAKFLIIGRGGKICQVDKDSTPSVLNERILVNNNELLNLFYGRRRVDNAKRDSSSPNAQIPLAAADLVSTLLAVRKKEEYARYPLPKQIIELEGKFNDYKDSLRDSLSRGGLASASGSPLLFGSFMNGRKSLGDLTGAASPTPLGPMGANQEGSPATPMGTEMTKHSNSPQLFRRPVPTLPVAAVNSSVEEVQRVDSQDSFCVAVESESEKDSSVDCVEVTSECGSRPPSSRS